MPKPFRERFTFIKQKESKLPFAKMFCLSFSQSLLATGAIFWLVCLGADVISGLQKSPAVDPTAALCFFGAVAAAFLAGAVYGREAEHEKAQREKQLEEDLVAQPLLDSEKGETKYFHGEFC
ncbi:hypothetical protein VE00_08854 [Pseudogymnoascus sp. WSF 3629]|nr:hypothetical protein VE00_08854 [Pseudogymnoascus sp. WSF 3629]